MSKADLIFHGKNIITMDDSLPLAEAVAVLVGTKTEVLKLAGPGTQIVELRGSETLLPGFIEPHQHATHMIMNRCMYINCGAHKYETYDDIKKLIEETVADIEPASGEWAMFFGWDPEMIPTLPKLNFALLDTFSTKVPIVMIGQSGHVAWANRKVFEVAKIPEDIKDPDGGVFVRDENGKLTGQMLEGPAMLMAMCAPFPTIQDMAKALKEQWDEYTKCGFTTLTELAYMPTDDLDDLVQEESTKPDCSIRLAMYKVVYGPGDEVKTKFKAAPCCCAPLPQPKKKAKQEIKENDKLWIAGIKVTADGSPHCGTAAVREKYLDTELTRLLGFPPTPCYGMLNYDDASLLETIKYWHGQGYQVSTHAHGETAIEQVLKTYEQVRPLLKM